MNSLLNLQQRVLAEAGTRCGIDTLLDSKTMSSRFEAEGEEFLTITLPSYVKGLYKALDQGMVTSDLFASFKRRKGQKLPVFLGDFLGLVFDRETGVLLDVTDGGRQAAIAIQAICQIAGFSGKLFEQASPKRTEAALRRYIENDGKVVSSSDIPSYKLRRVKTAFAVLFGSALEGVQRDILFENLRPAHGPGAVADGFRGNAKWQQPPFPERLESVFPFARWGYNSYLNYLDDLDRGLVPDPGAELSSKVESVPKTAVTPRLIAIEPVCMQYMQQAIRGSLERHLFSDPVANSVMGYTYQEPNQLLARRGSIYGDVATLDLSDASDLVSYELVRDLVKPSWPLVWEAFDATRSKTAWIPSLDHKVELRKFASMGSALCFPIEAMVFSAIALAGVAEAQHIDRLGSALRRHLGSVRVYGDDIIVPTDTARLVADWLEDFGLRVNRNKSFWTGMFRESCGKEYWSGFDVTYAKLRHRLPSPRGSLNQNTESIVHTVALRNNLREKGYDATAHYLDGILNKHLKGVYPAVSPSSSALGRHSLTQDVKPEKWDAHLQRPLVKAYVVQAVLPDSRLDGHAALMKCLVNDGDLPIADPNHLLRAGRPVALRIKQRWVSPL